MADPNFFVNNGPFTLGQILAAINIDAKSSYNTDIAYTDVAPLSSSTSTEVSFLDNIKYKDQFAKTNAGLCFIPKDLDVKSNGGGIIIPVESPHKCYALTAQLFYPAIASASIAPNASIDSSAHIGQGTHIGANVSIGPNVKIGDNCIIGANVAISHSIIGNSVTIYPGVCIGQDGFGFVIDPAGHVKVPQLGRVIIEDNVEIGSNTTIDRGSGPDTVIGQGTWIDNLVQIAHNVKIGRGCVIAAQCGISGSTTIEDYVVLAGQVGIAGHLHIGKGAQIGAKSGILRDVAAGGQYMGYPLSTLKQFLRQVATLKQLTDKGKS